MFTDINKFNNQFIFINLDHDKLIRIDKIYNTNNKMELLGPEK
jgi:hypothetical protein